VPSRPEQAREGEEVLAMAHRMRDALHVLVGELKGEKEKRGPDDGYFFKCTH
jgi:hypothetical protein